MKSTPEEMRKVTVNLPARLIDSALRDSGKTLTETLEEALKAYRQRRLYEKFRALRGKVEFSLTYEQIKEDRE